MKTGTDNPLSVACVTSSFSMMIILLCVYVSVAKVCDVSTRSATVNWDPAETVISADTTTTTTENTETETAEAPKELDISYEVTIGLVKTGKAAGGQHERSCYKGKECRYG